MFHYTYESDVESFSNQGAETALITAGRYVGLDLPSKICQVGIITRVPFNFDPLDSFIEDQLGDKDFIYQQVAHRLVQAFGRCNRSLTDIAVYFCLDGRLESEITGTERITKHFPCELMAQAQLGYAKCEKKLDKAIEIGKLFLSGGMQNYESDVKEELELIPPRGRVGKEAPDVILKEIKGWNELVITQNYYSASEIFKQCAEHYSNEKSSQVGRRAAWFWYWSAMCDYLQFKLQKAGEPLKRACIEKLEKAMKQGNSGWFNNIRVTINELKGEATDNAVIADSVDWTFREKVLRNWIDFNINNTTKKKTPLSVYDELLGRLQKGSHEEILEAIEKLFYLYGFEVRNCSHKAGENDLHFYANDVQNKYMVIVEVKSKKDSDVLGKRDVDQAKGNISQYQQRYSGMGMKVYCLLITNKSTIDQLAINSAKNQCRIMKSDSAVHLAKSYLPLMEESWKSMDAAYDRVLFLNKIPTLETLRNLFEEVEQPEITISDVEKIFKKS